LFPFNDFRRNDPPGRLYNIITMPSKSIIPYTKIEREVNAIVARGAENLKAAHKRQVLVTNWEVGRYLNKTLPLSEKPSAGNARIISRLAKKLGRPDGHFYMAIKFAREYPKPPKNSLPWSYYKILLSVSDHARRKKYEQMALKKNIPERIFHGMVANDKIESRGDRPAAPTQIPLTRGRLYHYRVTAPAKARSNTGTATLDVGFKVYRNIPLDKKSGLHAGHMVRTIPAVMTESYRHFTPKMFKGDKDLLYTYKAKVDRVVDGDTHVVTIDLGLKTETRQKLRLRGIDCPERSTKRGKYVKDYVKKLLDKQKFIIVKTHKDDKYGRMLADIFYLPKEKNPDVVAEKGKFLNQELVDKGLAQMWQG